MREANFFARLRRHREPGHRDAGRDAQEAEHAAQPRRERPQDLRARHLRDRRLHRRLRQREGRDRRRDDRAASRTPAIPVCMVGLLYALPNTQLTRRLSRKAACMPATTSASDATTAISARPASTSTPLRPRRDDPDRLQARGGDRSMHRRISRGAWKSSPPCSTAAAAGILRSRRSARRDELGRDDPQHHQRRAWHPRNILEHVQDDCPQQSGRAAPHRRS